MTFPVNFLGKNDFPGKFPGEKNNFNIFQGKMTFPVNFLGKNDFPGKFPGKK